MADVKRVPFHNDVNVQSIMDRFDTYLPKNRLQFQNPDMECSFELFFKARIASRNGRLPNIQAISSLKSKVKYETNGPTEEVILFYFCETYEFYSINYKSNTVRYVKEAPPINL